MESEATARLHPTPFSQIIKAYHHPNTPRMSAAHQPHAALLLLQPAANFTTKVAGAHLCRGINSSPCCREWWKMARAFCSTLPIAKEEIAALVGAGLTENTSETLGKDVSRARTAAMLRRG